MVDMGEMSIKAWIAVVDICERIDGVERVNQV